MGAGAVNSEGEAVYNVFLYVDDNQHIDSIGIMVHYATGTDEEKLANLQARVASDHPDAIRLPLSPPLPIQKYRALYRLGQHIAIFEPLMQLVDAPVEPLQVVTFIINGEPRIEGTADVKRLGPSKEPFGGHIDDYLVKYMADGRFDLPQLIDDDYIDAIRLLFGGAKYVSASKLIVSCIDTLAFVEYGDVPENFGRWVDAYMDVAALGVTSTDLWEFRNAVLHMTSLESRRVAKGGASRLVPCVSPTGTAAPVLNSTYCKLLDMPALLKELTAGVGRWAASYNTTPEKFLGFIQRYDLTISEARMRHAELPLS